MVNPGIVVIPFFLLHLSFGQKSNMINWAAPGYDEFGNKMVYEDEIFRTTPIIDITWNAVAKECSDFKIQSDFADKIRIVYASGDEIAQVFLDDTFMDLLEDKYDDKGKGQLVKLVALLSSCSSNVDLSTGTGRKTYAISVKPINRYPPTIRKSRDKIQIQENKNIIDILETLTAKDLDMNRGNEMTTLDIKLENSNDNTGTDNFRILSKFIGKTEGYEVEIYLNNVLDYEIQNSYMLDIKVTDKSENRLNAKPPHTVGSSLFIDVLDVHDQPPKFMIGCGMMTVDEETPVDTTIVTVKAIDSDTGVSPQGKIKYELIGSETVLKYFQVDSDTGVLSVKTPPNLKDPELKINQLMLTFDIMAVEFNGATNKREETFNSANTTCILTIIDIDNSPPIFNLKEYEATIPEHSSRETPVKVDGLYELSVKDEDMGKNAEYTIDLEWSGDVYKDMFQVIPKLGMGETIFSVRVKDNTNLEYDDDRLGPDKKVVLRLIATGTLNSGMTDNAVFTIKVTDENDNSPTITSQLTAEILENSVSGTELTKVEADDRDSGLFGVDGLVFSIPASSSLTESFEIDKKSGKITLKPGNKVDREVQEILYLPIEVADNEGNTPSNRVTGQIEITVLDDNDNAPIFQVEKFSTILNENEDDFQGSVKLEAKDNDKPNTNNSKVEYHLNEYEQLFEVDRESGDFKLWRPLDFEMKNALYPKYEIHPKSRIASREFTITVYANDWGEPKQYSKKNATIIVKFMDMNDNVPKFVSQTYETEIEEVLPPRSPINARVEAIDADISPAYSNVYYSLSQDEGSNFLVNRSSGEITVAPGANLAPEENNGKSIFELTVQATDGLSDNDDDEQACIVTVNVIDVNNQKPIFNDEDQTIILTSFEEENEDAVELAIFLAKDVDKTHKLEYTINYDESRAETPQFSVVGPGYNWKKVFKIGLTNGVLTAQKADREEMKRVVLVIEAKDVEADKRYSPQIVKLQREFIVLDINDHAPEFVNNNGRDNGPEGVLPSYKTEVLEHEERANLFKIEATDKDENNTITFELLPYKDNDITYFNINKTTGVVSMKEVDYDEGLHWMNVTIQATDNGVPTKSSLAYIIVQIIDKNDQKPIFNESINYNIWMKENEPINTLIITLHATDIDEKDEYGLVNYRFHKDEKDSHMFNLDAVTGELRNQEELDYEERTEFKISVEAFDNPREPKNSNSEQKYVLLNLIDVNDNAPVFDELKKCLWCQEDYAEGIIVDTITATDKDSPGPNSQIEFIMEEDDHGFFKIDLKGTITVNKNLTNHPGVYNITITARDKGEDPGPLNTTKVFCIEIADINNNRPKFEGGNQFHFLPEATIGESLEKMFLTRVKAVDIDLGDNGRVTYTISVRDKSNNKETPNAFTIKENTGHIYVEQDLKKKDVAIYVIQVNAHDNGVPVLYADPIQLEVEIISDEDRLPQFNKNDADYPLNFTENEPPGAEYQIIPEANYRDVEANNNSNPEICYFIIGGDVNIFLLDKKTRNLTVTESLDRETHAYHKLIVQAKACNTVVDPSVKVDNVEKPDVINVTIRVIDVNDNPPQFIMKPFTSGVSTSTKEDRKILTVKAIDPDEGPNAVVNYAIYGKIQTDGTENVNLNNDLPPFVIGNLTGDINVTFPIAKNMKGHFNFTVLASDIDQLNDTVQVLIYFFRDDQQIILTVDKPLNEINEDVKYQLTNVLTGITKHYCSVVAVKQYESDTPTIVQKNYSNIYVLFVNNVTQRVLETDQALTMINTYNKEIANSLADTIKLVDARPAEEAAKKSSGLTDEQLTYILIGISTALVLALMVAMTLSCLKISALKRNLKAASATAFGSQESGLNRVGVKSAPNTNQHTVEGSNPVWNHKDEILYNDHRSLYGSETASFKSDDEEDLNETIEDPNESKVNPAFLDDEYIQEEKVAPQSYEIDKDNGKKNNGMFKKNTINTLRQIDKDWRRRNTEGELQVDAVKKNMMNIFDLPDSRRRQSTFIAPVPTSEL